MGLEIYLTAMGSRTARSAAAGGSGVRRIATNAIKGEQDQDGNDAGNFYNALNRFGNSLMAGTLNLFKGVLSFSFTKLWSACVSSYMFLFNFNWNSTDQQLDDQIKQAEIAIGSASGAFKGAAVGYAICGIIPTATIAVFNEALAVHALLELGEEAAEELVALGASLVRLTLKQQVRKAFVSFYKNFRSILRPIAINIAQSLVSLNIFTQDAVDKGILQRNQPWSFAGALEESIESIEDPAQQAETEEFYEQLGETCIESGYIIAGSIDGYFAQQRIADTSRLGRERIIELELSRDEPT